MIVPPDPFSTVVVTASGRRVDLVDPVPASIHPRDIADALARLSRFGGHVAAGPWSVAAHSLVAARAAEAETRDRRLALLVLLHDAHEAYIGDLTTPAARALARVADIQFEPRKGHVVAEALTTLKLGLDGAIHARFGLRMPSADERRAIRDYDARALATEWRHLMHGAPPDACAGLRPLPTRGRLTVEPWPAVADDFAAELDRLARLVTPSALPRGIAR